MSSRSAPGRWMAGGAALIAFGFPDAGGTAAAQGFTEVTEEAGIRFVHDAGDEGNYSLPEITGAGSGFFDADGDGDLDLYLLQGGRPTDPPGPRDGAPGNALYLQTAPGRFEDRSAASGTADTGYGMGLAAADFDGDGLTDLFVTNYGPDVLYRNVGEGRFEDRTTAAGVGGSGWSSSAAVCDFDRDGRLDLYVARYVRNDPTKLCTRQDGTRDYCSPQVFPGTHDYLYRNLGGFRFEEVSLAAGLRAVHAPGLGVVCSDFDGDGLLDFYVANDGEANQLWLNQGDGSFVDDAFLAGVALNDAGRPEAGMGIALGDVDADQDLDLFITHVADETNTLYRSDGAALGLAFADRTGPSGLGPPSMAMTGFGVSFVDLDLDGALDLVVANGGVQAKPPLPGASGDPFWRVFSEPNQAFRNTGNAGADALFTELAAADDFTARVEVSRGLALADYDDDGDLDLLLANAEGPARLYRNDFPRRGNPLSVRALGAEGRPAFPAVVTAVFESGRRMVRRADPGGSYLASGDPRALFGIPEGETVADLEVVWPDGTAEGFPGGSGGSVVLRRGEGRER